jgi:predicted glycosyltransferase
MVIDQSMPTGNEIESHRERPSSRFCFVSGDNFGIGHVHHNAQMANALLCRARGSSALIVTGTESAVLPSLAGGGDYLRLPPAVRLASGERRPARLGIAFDHLVQLRSAVFEAVVREYSPEVLYVHHLTANTRRELELGVRLRSAGRPYRILGLDHLLNHRDIVMRDWLDGGLARFAARNFDEIWVYGDRMLLDVVKEYEFPYAIERKVSYLGFFPRKIPAGRREHLRRVFRAALSVDSASRLVVVTGGGGRDAMALYARYLGCVPSLPGDVVSLVVTGPLLPLGAQRQMTALAAQCAPRRVIVRSYVPDLHDMLAAADVVVGMAGAGTVLEMMAARCPGVVVPRGIWASGQQVRGRLVSEQGWLPVLPLSDATPERLGRAVQEQLDRQLPDIGVRFGGVDVASRRLREVAGIPAAPRQ